MSYPLNSDKESLSVVAERYKDLVVKLAMEELDIDEMNEMTKLAEYLRHTDENI